MKGFTTKAIHTGYRPNHEDGAVILPLHLSTTFAMGNAGGYDYSRSNNPTREVLEATLATLDGNTFGLAYSSGSAVLANVVALLGKGERIMFSSDAYGGTYRFIVRVAHPQGILYDIVDFSNLSQVEKVLKSKKTKIVWVETPTNPLLKLADIAGLNRFAKHYGAWLVVDNTFASPILQRPAEHGADIVVYSTTKYINGHSDSVGGALTTSDNMLYEKLKFLQNAIGAMLSPFDAWLTLRGLRTLELRMQRHCENAESIAGFLREHPKVARVYYPLFVKGNEREIFLRQMKHAGGMVSFELVNKNNPRTFIKALKYIPLAESLGGVESLLDHPASMTHTSIPAFERQRIGLSDELFRLSVGIENIEDLLEDLSQALDKV